MGILSFLSDVKVTLKFLFLVGSLALHKYGTSVAFINHVRCTDFQKSGLSVPPSQTQDIVQNSEIPRQNRQPLIRTLMAKEVAVYAEGQDASELFALYNAPPPECDSNCCVPIKTGVLKARGEVHRDGDWHRSVHIWIGDDKGNLMLQRRSKFKDTFPNCWDVSAGGHITGYDSVMETAVREVEEEVGLELPEQAFMHVCCVPSRLKGTTKRHGDFYDNEFQDMYLVIIEGLQLEDMTIAEGEVAEIKFMHYTEARKEYDAGNQLYVPRPKLYFKSLFEKMDKLFDGQTAVRRSPIPAQANTRP